jgi:hypothetical protein
VLLPAGFSLVMIALYFCGVQALQSLVAPTLEGMQSYSWREFGALELLQNFILLCLLFYLVRCLRMADRLSVMVVLVILTGLVTFVFLEEIDYGAHLLDLFTGRPPNLSPDNWDRNLHNRTLPSGEQVASYLKLAGNILVLGGFVIAPLVFGDSRNRTIRLLVPSKWVIATVAVAIGVSWLAHTFDDHGFGIINDVQGNLHLNISEFREACVYYLFLVYAAALHERLVHARA